MKRHLLLLIATLPLWASCGLGGTSEKEERDKPLITVSIEPLRYFTEALAGDRFEVTCMVPKGASPETYDPTPQQMMDLSKSEAFFRIGYIGFEQAWADRLADNAPHLRFYDLSQGVDLIYDDTEYETNPDKANAAHDHNHAKGIEPHIWNSPLNAEIIAGNIYHALCDIDKGNDSIYLQRYDSLCQRIARVDSLCCDMLSAPGADRSFMIYHPALSYFARDYGLMQISIEAGGKEPSPTQLKELMDFGKEEKVRVIFVQPEFDRRNAELIAAQTGTTVVPINPLSYDWEQEMLNTARALSNHPMP